MRQFCLRTPETLPGRYRAAHEIMREASLTLAVVLGVQLHVTDASTYALEPGTGDPILFA